MSIRYFSILVLASVEKQDPFYRLQVTAGKDLMNSDKTECNIWSLLGSE